MFPCCRTVCIMAWVLLLTVLSPAGADTQGTGDGTSPSLETDLAILKAARIETDGPGLMSFFKKRTLSEEKRKQILGLIQKLGDDEFEVREKATKDLQDIGPLTRALLTQALKNRDLEIRRRARSILAKLGPVSDELALLPPAARVLAHHKPAGVVKALLDFMPNIEEIETAEEVARALVPLALDKDGEADKTVLAALTDPIPLKRFAAGSALARAGSAHWPAVRKLLKDPDIGVRRRIALTLLEAHDKQAIPVLIELLTSASGDDAGAAEEALSLVAGEKAPESPDFDTPMAKERYRDSWRAWWKESGKKIDLKKVDFESVGRGFTLVGLMNVIRGGRISSGAVMELDKTGKVRWQIDNLTYPVHVCHTRRDRVLICEYSNNRISERDLKGKIIWQKNLSSPVLSSQRLPNGNTFVVTRAGMVELNRSQTIVRTIRRNHDVLAAHRHKDGKITMLSTSGNCITLDSDGRQLRSFSIGSVSSSIGFKPHFLPSGNVVVPDYIRNQVREYDNNGKLIATIAVPSRPTAVVRLSNGNTLVASRLSNRIYEMDKDGRQVSSQATEGRPVFVDRR